MQPIEIGVSLYQQQGYLAPVEIFPSEKSPRLLEVYQRLRTLLPPDVSTQKMDSGTNYDALDRTTSHP